MRKVLIIGATSAIAQATARLFAATGDNLYLVARNSERLQIVYEDLKMCTTGEVYQYLLDVNQVEQHKELLQSAIDTMNGLDLVLIAHGTLPDQKACEGSVETTLQEIHTNFLSTVSLLTLLANHFEQEGQGSIAVITSVAGDRGRQSNYVYGSAKGALTLFLQGLRNRLAKKGVHVLTIKPGFVDTPMTTNLKKGKLWVSPEIIAKGIYNALKRKKNVVYLPWFWQVIMAIIKAIPESIFKKLRL